LDSSDFSHHIKILKNEYITPPDAFIAILSAKNIPDFLWKKI
jgi:hypothetical protein